LLFRGNNGCANAPRHYVKLTLPELFDIFLELLYPDGEILLRQK